MKSGCGNNEKLYGVTARKRRKQRYLKVELIKTSTTIIGITSSSMTLHGMYVNIYMDKDTGILGSVRLIIIH